MFILAHWCMFMMAALNFLSDISSIYIISMLASGDCVFLIQVEGFLFLVWVLFYCILNITYTFMKPYILFKSVLAGFLWHHIGRGMGHHPITSRWGLKSRFPIQLPLTVWGVDTTILLGRSKNSGSPLDLHWYQPGQEWEWHLVIAPHVAPTGTALDGHPCHGTRNKHLAFHTAFSDTTMVGW